MCFTLFKMSAHIRLRLNITPPPQIKKKHAFFSVQGTQQMFATFGKNTCQFVRFFSSPTLPFSEIGPIFLFHRHQ